MSLAYHPQTEVTNRALGDLLRCLVGDNIKSWDVKLCQAEFAHNHAFNRSVGFAPFQVVCGFVPRCPLDLTTLLDHTRTHGQVLDLVEDLQQVHREAKSNLEASMEKYKQAADSKRRELIFNPGDLVWIVLTKDRFPIHEYNKLKSRKIRPLEVVERINANAYPIKLPPYLQTSDVFNVKFLSPFHGDNEDPGSWSNPLPAGGT